LTKNDLQTSGIEDKNGTNVSENMPNIDFSERASFPSDVKHVRVT
jgi:hypothetical protein